MNRPREKRKCDFENKSESPALSPITEKKNYILPNNVVKRQEKTFFFSMKRSYFQV